MKAEIFNYKTWISETDPIQLVAQMEQLLKVSEYTVLNKMEHHFEPQGYTAVWLLAESHLAIHTFPEGDKTYIELSSCNEQKNNQFIKLLNQYLPSVQSEGGVEGANEAVRRDKERPNRQS